VTGRIEHYESRGARWEDEFADDGACNQHVQGWRYQMAVFANVTANEMFSGADALVDAWFDAWSDPDSVTREASLDRVASPDIAFKDQFSLVTGLEDLRPHLAAVHRFMPGLRLSRDGAVRHCQGTVLADWVARDAEGQKRGSGSNVFQLDASGRIRAVTGFWNPR